MKNKEHFIEIKSDIKLPSSDIVLEKGDRIKVLQEIEIETDTVSFYSHYASAIINGDLSGLSDQEERELQGFEDYLDSMWGEDSYITNVSDSYFGTPDFGRLQGDIADYTIVY